MIAPIKVSATEDGTRLYRFLLRHYPGSNMILVRRLCRSGEIRVNSKRCGENATLKSGDLVRVPPVIQNRRTETARTGFSLADLEKLRQRIIHDDEDVVVFDKPAGMAAQGGGGIRKPLDKMAAALFPNDTVLLVHRLDKETSGIIVVAKNHAAAQKLARDFQTKDVKKTYIALLAGGVRPKKGIIDEPVDGKKAVTRYDVLGELKDYLSFVRFSPETGRKHQLRVHSAGALGAPIVGDDVYGSRRLDGKLKTVLSPNRLHLFASKITFRHPKTGKLLTISAAVPEWLRSVADLCDVRL
ncbi:MAG: RluA family pseudouridine synthase [Rickettsiales bacterium]|jgi:23S rRNA pseudouridine955/2504/2580 synthase|nr:RluA family pseudouridine synthase [Rickettsiales bacterium]